MAKERYITIDGEDIAVTEEVYRAFKRPAWAERKRKKVREEHELSLEVFMEDGFELPSSDAPIEKIAEDRLLLEALVIALGRLSADDYDLIDARYYQAKSERKVALETGVPRKTLAYREAKILAKLKEIICNL